MRYFYKPIHSLEDCVLLNEMTEECIVVVLTSILMAQSYLNLLYLVFDNRMGVAIL